MACDVIKSSLQECPIASTMVPCCSSACRVIVSLYQRGVNHVVRMACHCVPLPTRCHPGCTNGVALCHFIHAVSPMMFGMSCDHSYVLAKTCHFDNNMSTSWCHPVFCRHPVLSNFISDWLTQP